MKKISIISIFAILLMIPSYTYAFTTVVPWLATSTTQGWTSLSPMNGTQQTAVANNFIGTSTATSTFAGGIKSPCFSNNGINCISGTGGSGTVTSVSGSGGTTGLTLTGGPITTSGTLTLGGTLAIANGGTAANTARTVGANVGVYQGSPVGGNNAIGDMQSAGKPAFDGQELITYYGNEDPVIWYGTSRIRYDIVVSGITVAPTVGANYSSNCSGTVIGTYLTGTAPSISGTIRINQNCDPPAGSFTLTKNSGTGDSSISASSWTNSEANWTHPPAVFPSVAKFGFNTNDGGESTYRFLNGDNINAVTFTTNGGLQGDVASGDAGFHVQNLSKNHGQSGNAINLDVTNDNLNSVDTVGDAIVAVPSNRIAQLEPSWSYWVMNYNKVNMRGSSVCSPGGGNNFGPSGPDGGNYCYQYWDLEHGLVRYPYNNTFGVYQPDDTSYQFTVSGLIATPSIDDIFTNNGGRFTITSTAGISGSSGTLVATGTSSPLASGNLVPDTFPGQSNNGSSTIAYSSVTVLDNYHDTMVINPFNGRISIGTSTQWAQLTFAGMLGNKQALVDFASTSPTGTTSLMTLLANGKVGISSSTPGSVLSVGGVANFTSATSTFYGNGLNLTAGCYAVNGTCIGSGGGGSGTVGSGTTGQEAYYASNGTTVTGNSMLVFNSGPSTFAMNMGIPSNAKYNLDISRIADTGNIGDSADGAFVIQDQGGPTLIGTNSIGLTSFTPILVTSGDIDNRGCYRMSEGICGWATPSSAGGNNITFNNSGYAGIGTTTPTASLSISSTTQQSGLIPLLSVASTTNASIFTILGNGKVGISSSTPQSLLSFDVANQDVIGIRNTSDSNRASFIGAGSNGPYLNVGVTQDDYRIQFAGTQTVRVKSNGVAIGNINTATGDELSVAGAIDCGSYGGVNSAPSNGIICSGNEGIGTSTPVTKIDSYVSATTTANLLLEAGTTGGCLIIQDSHSGAPTYTSIYSEAGTLFSKVATNPNTCN